LDNIKKYFEMFVWNISKTSSIKISLKDKINLLEQLSNLLQSWIPLINSFKIIMYQTKVKKNKKINEKNHNPREDKNENVLFSDNFVKLELFGKLFLINNKSFFQNQIEIKIINKGRKEKSIILKNNKTHHESRLLFRLKNKIHKRNKCHKK